MRVSFKSRVLIFLFLLIALLFIPGTPWSTRCQYKLMRFIAKAERAVSRWQGQVPRLISIKGKTDFPGARVQALDSQSGWATFCDNEGSFTLPDVLWYPGATYDLVISADDDKGRLVKVRAPSSFPVSGVIDAGKLTLDSGYETELFDLLGINYFAYEHFDLSNRDYYRSLFDELTNEKMSNEEKIDAINKYVAERLNYDETQWEIGSPRRILERGSQYCGHLSSAMAAVLAAAFPVRMVHLTNESKPPDTHVVVEVFYDGDWHLFDPTFGVKFKNKDGRVVSLRELKLNPDLVSLDLFYRFLQRYPGFPIDSLISVYTSGHHRFYYMGYKRSQYAHAWWVYKNGLNYVPRGGSILLAGAGIRPGTNIVYHIRKPGDDRDELIISSQGGGNSNGVLDEEESPPINLPPGFYEVSVDLYDGNVMDSGGSPLISNWRRPISLEVR